jgi:hypothetical protein
MVPQEILVLLVLPEPQVQQAIQEPLAKPAQLVQLVLPVQMEQMAQLVLPEPLEIMV